MKKGLCILLACMMLLGSGLAAAEEYPVKNLNGIIAWGAGGGTDTVMRPLCSLAEKHLGRNIVNQNMTGGTGSIATQYVYDGKADGYTLLLHAENPAIYRLLDISDLSFDDFTCVFLVGDETVGIITAAGSEYNTLQSLTEAALAAPGKLTLATTGVGGLPWEVGALLTYVTGATFNQIPYDSDASALTAVMNGECMFTVCKIQTGIEAWKDGRIQYLTMLSTEPVEEMEEVLPVTSVWPEFEQFLPWGPFYGVYVKKGTDEAKTEILARAFEEAFEEESYQTLLGQRHINPLGLTGEAAENYIRSWQETTGNALKTSGALD